MYEQQIIGLGFAAYAGVGIYNKIQYRRGPKKAFPVFKMLGIPVVLTAQEKDHYADVNLVDQVKTIVPKIQDFLSINGQAYIQGTMYRAEDFMEIIKGTTRDMIKLVPVDFAFNQITERAKNIGGEGAIITQMDTYDQIQRLGAAVDRIVDDRISLDWAQQQLLHAEALIEEYFNNREDYTSQTIGFGTFIQLSIPEIAKALGGVYIADKAFSYFAPNINATEDTASNCEMDLAGEVNEEL